MAKDLLLEIGLEEVPAKFMPPALNQLKEMAANFLTEKRVEYKAVATYGTPRRIVLQIEALADKQGDLTREVRGPAKKAAFDENGNPTKAVLGFAKGQGIDVAALEIRDTGNGEYVFAQIEEKGQAVLKILPEILLHLITSLSFPKSMRWADCDLRFVRPIKWLLALYGEEIVDFSLAGVQSNRITYGHRFLSEEPLTINDSADYFTKMADNYVVVKEKEREQMIVEQVKATAKFQKGEAIITDDLLEEVTYLVEYPTALYGTFAEEYLALPQEVLITSMKEHQRYFPVVNSTGKLLPLFITVRNGTKEHIEIVRDGNERVLRARLSDAKFFFDEDKKIALSGQVDKLKTLLFQEGMGSMYDKTQRLISLTAMLAKRLEQDIEIVAVAQRIAYLCKADLVTNMVKEFTELQGVMGREYALVSGEKEEVAVGIFEHYLPRFAGDILPQSTGGKVASLADKMDTLVACFALGLIPTGSQDPYALRRQAYGIVNILLAGNLPLLLEDLIEDSLSILPQEKLKNSSEQIKAEVMEFFRQRIKNLLLDKGIKYDVVDAVMASSYQNLARLWLRAQAVSSFLNRPEMENLLAGFTRVDNLAKKAEKTGVDSALFQEEVEKQLYEAYLVVRKEVMRSLQENDYKNGLLWLSKIRGKVDAFLEETMVMVEDIAVRNNRLALLKEIQFLFLAFADFSLLVRE